MRFIKFDLEKDYIRKFTDLTKKIYNKNENTENSKEIIKILTNKHPLSKYFKLDKFLILKKDEVVGRFVITTYPNDSKAYMGFFECINDDEVAKYLFDVAYNFAKENNYESLVGPVDASFWIKYRLKINMFDKIPYTGEPYNKDYYLELFQNNEFKIIEHYTSNIYDNIDENYINEKYNNRYEEFLNKGYKIVSPKIEEFEDALKEFYYLIIELYKDFPIYKRLSSKDFIKTFSSYKQIINTSMIKFAYLNEKMVGFFISVPNYKNKVYHLNLVNILKIIKFRKNPTEYVMLYMGVDKSHTGLGKALAYSIMKELKENNAKSIGALARDGKVTQNYVEDLIEDKYEYVLLERKIN